MVSPVSINDDSENSNGREIVTSPEHVTLSPNLAPGMSSFEELDTKNVATEYVPLQKYLKGKGLHYHPPSSKKTRKQNEWNDLEQSLHNYTDVDVLDDDNRFICNHCNRNDSTSQKEIYY